MNRPLALLVSTLFIQALLPGCGPRRAALDPGAAGELRAGGATLRGVDLYPEHDTRMIELDPETRRHLRVEVTRQSVPDSDGVWTQMPELESLDGSEAHDGQTERSKGTTLRRLNDGSVALRSIVARTPSATSSADALYLFVPELVMVPATLEPGGVWEQTCDLRVVDLYDPERVIKRGSATRRIEHAGSQTLHSATGPVDAVVVRTEMALDMGAIRSVTKTEAWLAPGDGTLLESSSRVSSLMGIAVQRARELRVREGIVLDGAIDHAGGETQAR